MFYGVVVVFLIVVLFVQTGLGLLSAYYLQQYIDSFYSMEVFHMPPNLDALNIALSVQLAEFSLWAVFLLTAAILGTVCCVSFTKRMAQVSSSKAIKDATGERLNTILIKVSHLVPGVNVRRLILNRRFRRPSSWSTLSLAPSQCWAC